MPHLRHVGLKRPLEAEECAAFPFSVRAIGNLPTLDVNVPVTFFVGENGSGKSTLLEGIAAAAELPALGVQEVALDDTLAAQRRLGAALRLAWSPRSRQGFFLRAEDFFGHLRMQARTDARIAREKAELLGVRFDHMGESAGGSHLDERNAARFLAQYDARSHGESFLDVFSTRLHAGGLYLLDEPEAPLSPMRQLAVLRLIMRAARDGAQFIIATHSPILLACPGARIFSFDELPIREVAYASLAHVNVMRSFLDDPVGYLTAGDPRDAAAPKPPAKPAWGDTVRVTREAPLSLRPGDLAKVVGLRAIDTREEAERFDAPLGSTLYLLAFADGHEAEVPEVWVEAL